MSKEENIFNDASMQELSLDELQEVAGGKINVKGYLMLSSAIAVAKTMGKSKETVIQAVKHGWETGCKFRVEGTDGVELDLMKALEYVNQMW